MKTTRPSIAIIIALATLAATLSFGADTSPTDAFSGKIVFHQKGGGLTYDLIVTGNEVTGTQHWGDPNKPVAQIVGGWFDAKKGQLSILMQAKKGTDDNKWRSQAQHFRIESESKNVTLEHMLYGYGLTMNNSGPLYVPHVLDKIERNENHGK